MADYVPIPMQVQVPDPMKPLSSMLNIAQGVQSLQAQKLQMTGQDQQNQNNAITLNERQQMQKVLADPTQYSTPEGAVDYNKLIPQVMSVAPTTGMDYIGKMAQTEKQHTDAKNTILNLGTAQRQAVGQFAQGLTDMPIDQVNAALDGLAKQTPEVAPAIPMAKQILTHLNATQGQEGVNQGLARLAQMTLTPPQQMVPIASQHAPGTDLTGGRIVNNTGTFGQPQAPTASPQPTAPAQPGQPQPMVNFPAGESSGTKSALEQEALTAKNVAMAAPQMHANNQGILHELNNVSSTGVTGNLVAKAESLFGAGNISGSTDAERAASAYDLLGKYTERNALQAAQAMGPGTNAGLEAQIKANGSAAYNPTALKTVTKLNDALVTGSEKYNQGLQAAVQSSPNQIFAKRQFDTQWAQNADANTLKFLNAAKTGDADEAQAIIKSVGGKGSAGFNKLSQQLQNLNALISKGSL